MKYKVIVRPEAEDDLKEAFSWYEDKRTGLGYDFLLQVDAGINFINRNPEIHPIEYKRTRKHIIKRFPSCGWRIAAAEFYVEPVEKVLKS